MAHFEIRRRKSKIDIAEQGKKTKVVIKDTKVTLDIQVIKWFLSFMRCILVSIFDYIVNNLTL